MLRAPAQRAAPSNEIDVEAAAGVREAAGGEFDVYFSGEAGIITLLTMRAFGIRGR